MSDTYSLQKDVIRVIFSKIIDPKAFNFSKNSNHVYKILTEELSDSSVEAIIHLMLLESEYKALKLGDYVKVKPPTYHKRSEYELAILSDMGLLPTDNDLVYGKVVGDTSWSTDKPFNPFYSRIKLELLYHDTEKNLKSALAKALEKMELVSREEFEVQQAVLLRTREKLENMEQQ